MNFARLPSLVLLLVLAGCGGTSLVATTHPVRVLDSEAAASPVPQLEDAMHPPDSVNARDSVNAHDSVNAPRIGAPGGSGAGSRRVAPIQSGNETVGGLPAGIGGGKGPAGRG
jgi:hypothetical protein